jgi:hypothetical protein
VSKRSRHNGEGSIFPYRNGFAAYVWVTKPDGTRDRKWVYGKERDEVHAKWLKLHQQANDGPVATTSTTVGKFAAYWLEEIVKPNLAPGTYITYEVSELHRARAGGEAARSAQERRRSDVAQRLAGSVPVLRPGQGRSAEVG